MGHGPGAVEEGESPKLHGASFGTPDLEADGPEERGLALSVPPPPLSPREWGGGEVVRGQGETGSPPLVPPTVVEDLTI